MPGLTRLDLCRPLAALFLLAGLAPAASPRDEVLRYVPDDVGFCLVVQDLRGHARALAESPFLAEWGQSALARAARESAEFGRLARAEQGVRQFLGVGFDRLRDDVLGDAVAFAYRPGPPGQPQHEQGIVVLRARDEQLLADILDKVHAAQKAAGQLTEVEERTYEGVRYFCKHEKRQPTFYALRGPLLAVSRQEELLRRALLQDRALASEAQPPLSGRLKAAGADQALAALWLNPRAFDADLAARATAAAPPEATFLKQFAVYWKAFDDLTLSVHLGRDVAVRVALRGRGDRLPPSARRFLAAAARPSEVWRFLPDDALAAAAGRLDAAALAETVADFLPPETRAAAGRDLGLTVGAVLGKDLMREVLPHVGPDWGACLLPPADGDGPLPRFVAALRIAPATGPEPVGPAILGAMHAAALAAVVEHNKRHPQRPIRLRTSQGDGRDVRYLQGQDGLPPGVQPAFGLVGGHLVVASSPAELGRFAAPPAGPAPFSAGPVACVSLRGWRDYLAARGADLAPVIAERAGVPPDEARQRLVRFVEALRGLDRLDLTLGTGPDVVTLTLRLRTEAALRK